MKDATHASSDFAKKKTFLQQRQYLPVFAVRQEVRHHGPTSYLGFNVNWPFVWITDWETGVCYSMLFLYPAVADCDTGQ